MNRHLVAIILLLLSGTPASSQTTEKPFVESIRADGYLILAIAADLPPQGVRGNIYYEIVAEGTFHKIIPAQFAIVDKLGMNRYLARITSRSGQVNPGYFIEYQAPPAPAEPAVSASPTIPRTESPPIISTPPGNDDPSDSQSGKTPGSGVPSDNRRLNMVKIPAGIAIIGIDPVRSRFHNETPSHKIAMNGYYIDRHEVTRLEYQRFLTSSKRPQPPDWVYVDENSPSASEPVTGVSWEDAASYARWAGKRLPTEAEWEYAARGPKGFIYPWGNRFDAGRVNCLETGRKKPLPVETCAGDKSPFGLYDLAGNVSEWTATIYRPYPGNNQPEQDYEKNHRVVRGGAFSVKKIFCRSVFRAHLPAGYRAKDLGFRCAIGLEDLAASKDAAAKDLE